jgi:hypothetical protein
MEALMNLSGSAIAELQGTTKSLLDKFYESRGFEVVLPSSTDAPAAELAATVQPATNNH